MRIRSIKPEIMDDEKTGNLSHEAFRLFAGLILMADDYGNVRHLPARIQGFVFWAETNDGGETTRGMRELLTAELVTLYRVRGQSYLHINGWTKHQKVDKPGPPRCPGPEEADVQEVAAIREPLANQSRSIREPLAPDLDRDLDRDLDPDRDHARGSKREESEPPAADPVAATVAEMQRAAGAVGARWTRGIKQAAAATVRALGSDGHGPAIVLDAWARYCADDFWLPKGLPLDKFREHFPRFAAAPAAPKPSADEKRRAVGRPSSDWRVCECGHPAARYHDGGRCKATSCGCESFRESAEEVTA